MNPTTTRAPATPAPAITTPAPRPAITIPGPRPATTTPAPAPATAFAARLLAFTFAAAALVDALFTALGDRIFAAAAAPATPQADREALVGSLTALTDGGALFSILLALLGALAAVRYARGLRHAPARHLALGTATCLALDAARELGLLAILPSIADASPDAWAVFLRSGDLAGVALQTLALALITAAVARHQPPPRPSAPRWTLVAAALLGLYLVLFGALLLFSTPRDPLAGITLADIVLWLGHAASFTVALGLLLHAARLPVRDPARTWARAARGLGLYRNATALRLLIFLLALLLLFFARGGLSLLHLLAILGVLTFSGVLSGLFQILGLVRLADAPAARPALALALPLFALSLAGECLALAPLFHYVRSAGHNTDGLRQSGLFGLTVATQAASLLAVFTLLLVLRALARARPAPHLARRCTALLVVLLAIITLVALAYLRLPTSTLSRDSRENLLLIGGFLLLVTAIWMVVSYLRTLTLLRAAMAAPHNAAAAIQR